MKTSCSSLIQNAYSHRPTSKTLILLAWQPKNLWKKLKLSTKYYSRQNESLSTKCVCPSHSLCNSSATATSINVSHFCCLVGQSLNENYQLWRSLGRGGKRGKDMVLMFLNTLVASSSFPKTASSNQSRLLYHCLSTPVSLYGPHTVLSVWKIISFTSLSTETPFSFQVLSQMPPFLSNVRVSL